MHVLTKFLVVLAAVLCVLLSGLSIAYTSNADRLRAEVKSERAAADAAKASLTQASAAAARDRENSARDLSAMQSQLAQMRQTIDDLTAQNSRLEADNKQMALNEANYVNKIDTFTQLIEANTRLADARATELNTLRQKELDSARKEIELTDRINDLSTELEVSRETTRALKEQLTTMREGGAGSSTSGTAEAAAGYLRAPRNLRARVTDVQTDVNGSVLVSISAGQSDQLKSKMKLNVVDDQGFLGSIVLERVDTNEAVGRVVLLRDASSRVQSGDLVLPADL